MAEDQGKREHPIVAGVAALIGVALVIGVVLGGGALVAAKALGLDNGSSSSAGSTAKDTLYIPSAAASSPSDVDPSVSQAPDPSGPPTSVAPSSVSPSVATGITLTAGETTVPQMGHIDLTGTYPGGQGAILQVQQFSAGSWTDFYAVSVAVSGEQFTTYVQTGIAGKHRFRVLDPDTNVHSNPVTVQVQ